MASTRFSPSGAGLDVRCCRSTPRKHAGLADAAYDRSEQPQSPMSNSAEAPTESWADLLRGCRRRGMTVPVLAVGVGRVQVKTRPRQGLGPGTSLLVSADPATVAALG
jgi:hypothetical protein